MLTFHYDTKFGAKMLIDAGIMAQNRNSRWRPIAILILFSVACRRDEIIYLFVCVFVCVFAKSKKINFPYLYPPKMGKPISVQFCTTTRLTDVMIHSERFFNIFNRFVFRGGRIFHYYLGLANRF